MKSDNTEGSHWEGTACAHVSSPPGTEPESGLPTLPRLMLSPGQGIADQCSPPEPVLHQAAKDEKLSLEIWAGLATVKMLYTRKIVPSIEAGSDNQYC